MKDSEQRNHVSEFCFWGDLLRSFSKALFSSERENISHLALHLPNACNSATARTRAAQLKQGAQKQIQDAHTSGENQSPGPYLLPPGSTLRRNWNQELNRSSNPGTPGWDVCTPGSSLTTTSNAYPERSLLAHRWRTDSHQVSLEPRRLLSGKMSWRVWFRARIMGWKRAGQVPKRLKGQSVGL